MTIRLPRPRVTGRFARLTAAITLLLGTLGLGVVGATSASADATVHTIVTLTPESWAPYSAYMSARLSNNTTITITCYMIGDTVTGPYGSENVWDEVSGGTGDQVETGTFVPDADVWTGSNSPVVPRCPWTFGKTIGSGQVPIYAGPGTNYSYDGFVNPGAGLEIRCYSTGTPMSGPYGTENIWDLITVNWFAPQAWIPDALIYTGSNSAVVPHC